MCKSSQGKFVLPNPKSTGRIISKNRRVAKNLQWGSCFGGLGAMPPAAGGPALENFAFFCKNNFILGLFYYKMMLLKRGLEIGNA